MAIASFPDGVLTELSHALADGDAMTGTEMSNIMAACRIEDTSGESTKWKRLYYTFTTRQSRDKSANSFGSFIESALEPARWASKSPNLYLAVRARVNVALAMVGLTVTDSGKLAAVTAANTLSQAQERSNRLRAKLIQRSVHSEVLRNCSELLLKDSNYFHAVFETVKGLAERVRQMSGLRTDGSALIQEAFEEMNSFTLPLMAFNRHATTTEKNEQRGIASLFRGLLFAFRHPLAHEPAEIWPVSEEDALDTMSVASLLHRRLDNCHRTGPLSP